MRKQNKKAVSDLIATVLIVGITIAIFALVASYLYPMIRNSLSGTDCSKLQLNVKSGAFTYYENVGTEDAPLYDVSVQISRGEQEIDLKEIQLKITDSTGNSKTIKNTELIDSTAVPGINEEKVYLIASSEHGLAKIPSTVAVAPIIEVNNEKIICSMSIDYNLKEK